MFKEWGRINILVNNAAVAAPGPFAETTTRRWNLVIGVNLLGTFLCTKAVLPFMMEQRSGSIINTSSGAADSRIYGVTGIAYGTAKAALFLAQQNAQGVTGSVVRDEEVIQWHGLS